MAGPSAAEIADPGLAVPEIMPARPFLRWAGGKRWLTRSLAEFPDLAGSRYFEPFVGSGAMFFRLVPSRATLTDANAELISTYIAIRDSVDSVIRCLRGLRNTERSYYRIRDSDPRGRVRVAARLIYLNRTAWNGLYRVNSDGEFNVPYGYYQGREVLKQSLLRAASNALQSVSLYKADFAMTIGHARAGDFIFVDPPYAANEGESGFLLYNVDKFSWAEQERLARSLIEADKRGVRFLLTNRNDVHIRSLYSDFEMGTAARASILAADSANRKPIEELLVSNCGAHRVLARGGDRKFTSHPHPLVPAHAWCTRGSGQE